jgi:hypothetical protein
MEPQKGNSTWDIRQGFQEIQYPWVGQRVTLCILLIHFSLQGTFPLAPGLRTGQNINRRKCCHFVRIDKSWKLASATTLLQTKMLKLRVQNPHSPTPSLPLLTTFSWIRIPWKKPLMTTQQIWGPTVSQVPPPGWVTKAEPWLISSESINVPGEDSNPWQSPNLSTSLNNLDNPEKVLKGIYLLGKDLEILSCFFFSFLCLWLPDPQNAVVFHF